jgi:hypothetical protein
MPVVIENNEIIITKPGRIGNQLGQAIICFSIGIFFTCMALRPKSMGTHFLSILISTIASLLLLIIFIRTVYFFIIDADAKIVMNGDEFIVNDKSYKLSAIDGMYVTEYENRAVSSNFNIYIKKKNGSKIPVAIGVKEEIMNQVVNGIKELLVIDKVEQKRYWLNI